MAKILGKKLKKIASKNDLQKGSSNAFNIAESYTSLIVGAIVVLIAGIIFVTFAKINRNAQTSSVMDTPKTWEQIFNDSNTSSTYTVRPGDDLWTISQNVYNNGYKWVEIAKLNNLQNPGIIYPGDKLKIPDISEEKSVTKEVAQPSQTQSSEVKNNSISGDTYTVVRGDNLWNIAVRAYGDGFRWPEIAKANHLANPRLIHRGNVLIIPR